MSLTGCPQPPLASAAELCAERVELMALLWQILDGDTAYCANPRLLMVGRLLPELRGDPAAVQLAALRGSTSRDRVVKVLTSDAHGLEVDPAARHLAEALDDLSVRWDGLLQGLAAPLTQAYRDMRGSADRLAGIFDPSGDMAALTGERDRLAVEILPSLFLPPPQNGRHSSLVTGADGAATGYLFYGFPIDNDPAQFGINRSWLLGGAWHYAVTRFIERRWPAMVAGFAEARGLEAALTAALAEHRDEVAWPHCIAEHLAVALKCALCRQAQLPDLVHRAFARTQGAAFFDWFLDWTMGLAEGEEAFVAGFERLPQTLAERQQELVDAAAAMQSGAVSINFALASRQKRVIVVPDHWDDELGERIRRRWALVARVVAKESEWRAWRAASSECLIAFGQIGRDPLVDELLGESGLTLEKGDRGGEVLVSLLPQQRARQPWQLAIGVHDPEVAGDFAAEHVMGLFRRTARFADYRLLEPEANLPAAA